MKKIAQLQQLVNDLHESALKNSNLISIGIVSAFESNRPQEELISELKTAIGDNETVAINAIGEELVKRIKEIEL